LETAVYCYNNLLLEERNYLEVFIFTDFELIFDEFKQLLPYINIQDFNGYSYCDIFC